MSWIICALIAVCLWTASGLIDKHVIGLKKHDPISATVLKSYIIFALFTAATLIAGKGITLNIPLILLAVIGGGLTCATIYPYYKALLVSDASEVMPIFSITPMFTLFLGALFLNEHFPWSTYIGITSMSVGAILMSIHIKEHRARLNPQTLFAIGVALFSAIRSVTLKFPLDIASPWPLLFWMGVGGLVVSTPLLVRHWDRIKRYQYVQERIGLGQFVLADIFDSLANLFLVLALALGPVSIVSAIVGIGPLVTFFVTLGLSLFVPALLKENFSKLAILKKSLATFFIVVGTLILAFSIH
ncbi:MAG: EamA family transporter [Patescibacteria group bacterium]